MKTTTQYILILVRRNFRIIYYGHWDEKKLFANMKIKKNWIANFEQLITQTCSGLLERELDWERDFITNAMNF